MDSSRAVSLLLGLILGVGCAAAVGSHGAQEAAGHETSKLQPQSSCNSRTCQLHGDVLLGIVACRLLLHAATVAVYDMRCRLHGIKELTAHSDLGSCLQVNHN